MIALGQSRVETFPTLTADITWIPSVYWPSGMICMTTCECYEWQLPLLGGEVNCEWLLPLPLFRVHLGNYSQFLQGEVICGWLLPLAQLKSLKFVSGGWRGWKVGCDFLCVMRVWPSVDKGSDPARVQGSGWPESLIWSSGVYPIMCRIRRKIVVAPKSHNDKLELFHKCHNSGFVFMHACLS